jgi:CheY-like chemotaxis protein
MKDIVSALLVDDEDAILTLFGRILQRDGFSVTTARSAADACAVLSREAFDLVVTDLRMETPTAGFEVVRAANRVLPRPAVVLLTAFPLPPSQWRQAGADALFIKGEDTMRLSSRLKAVVGTAAKTLAAVNS